MSYTENELRAATEAHIGRDEQIKALLIQMLQQRQRHWLVNLVSDVARIMYGNVIGSIVDRVVDWLYMWITSSSINSNTANSDCFIATVVYGSADSIEVSILRQFRDERLANSITGRAFIHFYYWFGPRAAWLLRRLGVRSRRCVRKALDTFIKIYLKKNKN